MPLSIPLFDLANYRQEVTLDDVSYILDFKWNGRAEQWSLSILQSDETPILEGLKLVLNYELLDQFSPRENVPPGDLFCIDTTGKETAITRDNLGDTVELIYIPEAEL